MNGPVQIMYKTKPIVRHNIAVSLPDCMYKIKSIHVPRNNTVLQRQPGHVPTSDKKVDISEQVKQFLKNLDNSPEMAALEERQQQILSQLSDLKKQMLSLKNHLKTTNNVPSQHVNKMVVQKSFVCPIEISKLPDIVINASPNYPPYSLYLIQKQWKDSLSLSVKSYVHSSISVIPEAAANLANALESLTVSPELPKINVRLIWKDVGANTEMVISPTVIYGEVNILRYLSRISPKSFNYELCPNALEIDILLDTCYHLVRSKTKNDRAKLLQKINKSLGKSQWLFDRKEIGIADIATFSAVKQSAVDEINVNMGKWLQRCEAGV